MLSSFNRSAVRVSLTAAALVACASGTRAIAADYTLNVNTVLSTADPLYAGLESFRDEVADRSGGRLEIKLFPESALGKDEEILAQAQAGAPVAIVSDGGRLSVFQPEFGVLGAPFLASGYDGIREVVTSALFEGWVEKLRVASGHQILSFNWWQGERHLLTNKPIEGPADLAGVRMRTPGAPVWMETVAAMGATPTPMPWAEVYNGLAFRLIDGAEAQFPAIKGAKLDEVISHITKTGHINLITGLVTSAQWFDSLPQDLQVLLREEALRAGDVASRGTEAALAQIEKDMAAKGVTINNIDTTPFREATAPVYDKLGYGELRDTLRAIAAGAVTTSELDD